MSNIVGYNRINGTLFFTQQTPIIEPISGLFVNKALTNIPSQIFKGNNYYGVNASVNLACSDVGKILRALNLYLFHDGIDKPRTYLTEGVRFELIAYQGAGMYYIVSTEPLQVGHKVKFTVQNRQINGIVSFVNGNYNIRFKVFRGEFAL